MELAVKEDEADLETVPVSDPVVEEVGVGVLDTEMVSVKEEETEDKYEGDPDSERDGVGEVEAESDWVAVVEGVASELPVKLEVAEAD